MVLRLIGLSFDVSDSIKTPDVLGIDDTRPTKIPSLLEVLAFSYFPATVIIGPQFTFKRYYDFTDKKFNGQHNLQHGLKRMLTGLFYLGVYQLGLFIVPDNYFLTPEFDEKNFAYKILLLIIWGRCTLYKYIQCWILSEGAAICAGLTFVSRDEKTGKEDWSGCANIKLDIFENTYDFGDYVASFNVQTNHWVLRHVYKRLRFLNNKSVSHISALGFLAVWHGFHSGYYITFFLEFLLVHFEKEVSLRRLCCANWPILLMKFLSQVKPVFNNNPKFQKFVNGSAMKVVVFLILKFYALAFAGYCLVPFAYLSFYKWWAIYRKFYFWGFIAIMPMSIIWKPLIEKTIKFYFPIDKEAKVAVADASDTNKNDPKTSQHEKVN